jgi:hypothetical protein
MGLALEVGMLADLKAADEEGYQHFADQFSRLNAVLEAQDIGQHVEPKALDGLFSCSMFGYTGLHFLRRIGMYAALGRGLPPPGTRDSYMAREAGEDYFLRYYSGENLAFQHLIVHSDAEGFYIPLDFKRVVEAPEITGGYVGSTQRLQAECRELAAALEIPAGLEPESDELFEAVDRQFNGPETGDDANAAQPAPRWKSYAIETYTCLQLLAACEASLKSKAAIVFC